MIEIENVDVRPVHRQGLYELIHSARFRVHGFECEVPGRFTTDGASIPAFAWWTTGTPFQPEHIRAAVLHDYLYRNNFTTRMHADQMFREILRFDGVGRYRAGKMYHALRAFGWGAWRRYRKIKPKVHCPNCDLPMTLTSNHDRRLMCEACAYTVEEKVGWTRKLKKD